MVQAGRLSHHKVGRRQGALGEEGSVVGLVLEGDGLVVGGKDHLVLPHHVAHAQGVDADLVGLALVLAAILLRGGEQKSESRIFWFGVILGGAYEYVCSAVTELLFGTVFWDYSGFKFNLGGRINLLYCFFWGIAAVTWIRYGYPLVAKGMKAVKRRIRPWMTALLAVFMAVNLVTSALALARYDARTSGAAPANAVDVLLDEHFDNARMERIYPNAKKVEKAG